MTDVTYKRGDTVPIEASLPIDSDEDLTEATRVSFHMNDSDGQNVIDDGVIIVDGNTGIVQYQWKDGETDVEGVYDIEWEVSWSEGQTETYPQHGTDRIYFTRDLA